MARGLTCDQAKAICRQGRGTRREDWRHWLVFNVFSGVWLEQLPAAVDDSYPQTLRIALSASATGGTPGATLFRFAKADHAAHDWTDEPWDVAFPTPLFAPADYPPVTVRGTDGVSRDLPARPIPYDPSLPPGPGAPSRDTPWTPPTSTAPVITITYHTSITIGACLTPGQYDGHPNCTIYMTVNIAGGPVFPSVLNVSLGGTAKPATAGFPGYENTFEFTKPVNQGATLTGTVVYHIPGGDFTAAADFSFPAACPLRVGFNFQADVGVTVDGLLADGDTPTLAEDVNQYANDMLFTPSMTAAQIAVAEISFSNGAVLNRANYGNDADWDAGIWFTSLYTVGSGAIDGVPFEVGANWVRITSSIDFDATLNFNVVA